MKDTLLTASCLPLSSYFSTHTIFTEYSQKYAFLFQYLLDSLLFCSYFTGNLVLLEFIEVILDLILRATSLQGVRSRNNKRRLRGDEGYFDKEVH